MRLQLVPARPALSIDIPALSVAVSSLGSEVTVQGRHDESADAALAHRHGRVSIVSVDIPQIRGSVTLVGRGITCIGRIVALVGRHVPLRSDERADVSEVG